MINITNTVLHMKVVEEILSPHTRKRTFFLFLKFCFSVR